MRGLVHPQGSRPCRGREGLAVRSPQGHDSQPGRAAAVRDLAESVGGTLDSYYLTFGQYDGLAIWEVSDSASAAAGCVNQQRRISHCETHELLPAGQINAIPQKAGQLTYRPPGTRSTMSGP
jgi:uncharacterized protein with GYD domain